MNRYDTPRDKAVRGKDDASLRSVYNVGARHGGRRMEPVDDLSPSEIIFLPPAPLSALRPPLPSDHDEPGALREPASPVGRLLTLTARPGEWEEAYLRALEQGYSKDSAAAVAGCSPNTPHKKRGRDRVFAEREAQAYHKGTHRYETQAQKRIFDPADPSDTLLRHILSHRGISAHSSLEVTGPGGGPIQLSAIPFDRLSLETRQRIVDELRESGDIIDVIPEETEVGTETETESQNPT